jgi:glycerophosphoryl diester phosphodiesterase
VPILDKTDRVWTMAHRGGSIDYQEHSARGYVQSAIAHVDVLEFSLGRTSDGVFFGLHDATLNRTTSGLAANYLASAHTWAEISALVQDLGNRGDPRFGTAPYLRLEDFIAQWSGSHTLMFDPKLINTAGRQALYPILQQIPRYQERVLGKFYHTGTAIADEFHAIGCKAWGYAYTEAITGFKTDGSATQEASFADTAPKWDYLGMEYSASAAVWAEAVRIADGKKIIGHIVGTVQNADDAVAKGARALQVAGVNAVSVKY